MPSSIPASFDPFAMHPFTNGSGLVPQPPAPSQYPTIPIPSPRRPAAFSATYNEYFDGKYNTSSSPSSSLDSSSSFSSQSPISSTRAPQPRRRPATSSPSHSPSSPPQEPIFVTFRKETASPELVLKKKAPKMKNASTQTPPEMSS